MESCAEALAVNDISHSLVCPQMASTASVVVDLLGLVSLPIASCR